jgi:hypothetical protein
MPPRDGDYHKRSLREEVQPVVYDAENIITAGAGRAFAPKIA